jgi:hypothetical protein
MMEVDEFALVKQYYLSATIREQNEYTRGQLYWCPCLYLDPKLRVLDSSDIAPHNHRPPKWKTRTIDPRQFNVPTHPPLTNPRLEADEEFVVLAAKRRPVILLSSQTEPWKYRGGEIRQECFLVAPMYSFDETDPPKVRVRIRALAYRELFYLPGHDPLRIRESYVRFDRVQVVPKGWLERRKVCLHPDALYLLTAWFQYYLTGVAETFMIEYRAELMDAADKALGTDD